MTKTKKWFDTKTYHRRYTDSQWDYKAVSTRVDGKEIIYYTLMGKGQPREGVEINSGRNYDIHSTAPSHSNSYSMSNVPKKYKNIVSNLKQRHSKIKWSKKSCVNLH